MPVVKKLVSKEEHKPAPLILPDRIEPSLGMNGRHGDVPLMAKDKRFEDEDSQPFHPRLGGITYNHGHIFGHATKGQAEALAKEICLRYNNYPELLRVLQDFVLDCDNGLGPSVERLRIAINRQM